MRGGVARPILYPTSEPDEVRTMRKIEYQHTEGDSRLLYGMGGPLLAAVALIVGVFLTGEAWLLPILFVALFVLTGMVLNGLWKMLGESGDDAPQT
jgi:hypothetical protein